jgi:hypothetical protein
MSKGLTKAQRIEQGKKGEDEFREWLNKEGIGFVEVKQNKDDLAVAFSGAAKRPDFLLLILNHGFIAIDVKNRSTTGSSFTIDIARDLASAVEFENICRIYLWFAFKDVTTSGEIWHFISAYDAVALGERRDKDTPYLTLDTKHFIEVRTHADIAKLFAARVGKVGTFARMVEHWFRTSKV